MMTVPMKPIGLHLIEQFSVLYVESSLVLAVYLTSGTA